MVSERPASILSMHLDSLDDVEHSKPVRTGCARVLTSSECLEALVEKKK